MKDYLVPDLPEDFEILEEMAYKIGSPTNSYIIYVNSDDGGKIPHFHYVDAASMGRDRKNGFHTCIRIDKAEYFIHGSHKDKLDSRQRKDLQNFLLKPFKRPQVHMTNWQFIVATWNDNNSDVILDENSEMPNYRELN